METCTKIKKLIPPVLAGALILFLLKFLLPLALPVLLGLGAAAALSPLIRLLQEHGNLRHGTAAALSVTGVLFLVCLGIFLLGRFLFSELTALYQQLPGMLSALSDQSSKLAVIINGFTRELPAGAADAVENWMDEITSAGGSLATSLYEGLFSLVSGFLGRLPDHLLFLLTMILSCYFAATELPRFSAMLREHLPPVRWEQLKSLSHSVKTVLGSWLRAQIKLMGVTFLILLPGFMLLGVQLPLFLALGVALLDALPLFGTGTVLLPWGLFSIITGDFRLGLGLILLYGATALSRNVLEPRFLGAQIGISPLITLLAIYAGYRISGFPGMILLPILVMLGAEVLEARHRPAPLPQSPRFSPAPE